MAQYDIYRNPSARSRDSVPYVVDVQSAMFDGLRTRLIVPLSRVGSNAPGLPRRLIPVFVVGGERLALHAHLATGVEARLLRDKVDSLLAHAGEIGDAFDAVMRGV